MEKYKKILSQEEYAKLKPEEKGKFQEVFFDENFSPGMGDDIDVSYRIYLANLRIYCANFWVDHHRSSEHFNDNQELSIAHGKYFRKKFKLGEFSNGKT